MRSFHGPHFSQAAIGGPAFRGSRDSWRPPMAGWFGGNHPSADSPRPAGSDNTAELREQVQRLQEQQERLAHAVRELTEALSRTRRD